MKKTNFTLLEKVGSKTGANWLVAAILLLCFGFPTTDLQAQADTCNLTCNDLVNVSLDGMCERQILPDDILENPPGDGCVLEVHIAYPQYYMPSMPGGDWVDGAFARLHVGR